MVVVGVAVRHGWGREVVMILEETVWRCVTGLLLRKFFCGLVWKQKKYKLI